MITYVKNGPVEESRSAAVRLSDARPSQMMGVANAQRTLGYIRVLTEFISQNEYQDVVQMFGVLNEPLLTSIGRNQLDRL